MALPTKEEMRARFWVLKNAIDATKDKVAALREKYEPQWNAAMEKRKAQSAEIKALQADIGVDGLSLFDAEMEQSFYAKGLFQVGTDPALADATDPALAVVKA